MVLFLAPAFEDEVGDAVSLPMGFEEAGHALEAERKGNVVRVRGRGVTLAQAVFLDDRRDQGERHGIDHGVEVLQEALAPAGVDQDPERTGRLADLVLVEYDHVVAEMAELQLLQSR